MTRKKILIGLGFAWALGAALALAAHHPANIAGRWTMTIRTPRGGFSQGMTIQQDGSRIKGTFQTQRGDFPFEGSIQDNKVHFTATRQASQGSFTMEYDGTVNGDTMKGTASNSRFNVDWTAKRDENAPAQ